MTTIYTPELPTELFDMILKMKTASYEQEKKEWEAKRNEFYSAGLEIHNIDEDGLDWNEIAVMPMIMDDEEEVWVEAVDNHKGWRAFDGEQSVLEGKTQLLFDNENKNVWITVGVLFTRHLITMIDADGERNCLEAYNWCKWVVNDFETLTPQGKQNAKAFIETDDE